MTRAPGWLPDPTGRHELRYWDGDLWSADVSDGGGVAFDPLEVPVTPPPSDATWPASSSSSSSSSPAADGGPHSSPPRLGGAYSSPATSGGRRSSPPATGVGASPSGPGGGTVSGDQTPMLSFPSTRETGIDPAARFPPRATTADPIAAAGPPRGRSSRRLVLAAGLLAVAGLAAVAVVLVVNGGDDDGSSSAAGSSPRDTSATAGTRSTTTTAPDIAPTDIMVGAVASGIVEGSNGAIDASEAECMGRALIDEIGIERLEELTEETAGEAGVNPLDLLTEAEQTGAMTRMRACVDQATLDSLAPGSG